MGHVLNRSGTIINDGSPVPPDIIEALNRFDATVTNDINASTGDFTASRQEIHWMMHHDKSKWNDYLSYRYRFKVYPKRRKLTDFPQHLLIEPSSACNLRCVMCFQSDPSFTVKENMGIMPLGLAKNLIDQAKANGCHAVTMAARGEPSLSEHLGAILLHTKKVGIMDVKINTNAMRMTEKLCHDILSAEISEIVFSVDAASKKTYEEIRIGGKFEKVIEGIDLFNEIREKHYPNSPVVTRMSAVIFRQDQNVEDIKSFWEGRVDEVAVKSESPCRDSYHNAPIYIPNPCSFLWERIYVWYDGTVNPCFFDYKSMLSVGNAYEQTLSEIWLGKAYQELRRDHIAGERSKRVPCDRCPIF